jgi:predicted nucleic acid-binding Zn ribbon protein
MPEKNCPICKKKIIGRSDKKFCSLTCKSIYYKRLRDATQKETERIDKLLHRNHSILLETLKHNDKIKITKDKLEDKGFQFKYCTGVYYNQQNKLCFYVYDFMWYELKDRRVYISKLKS